MMSSPVRVGAVSYLNAKPLYYSLCELCPGHRADHGGSQHAGPATGGRGIDVALIPSVEYLRGVELGYQIIPGFAIAARGRCGASSFLAGVPSRRRSSGWGIEQGLADQPGARQGLAGRAAWGPSRGQVEQLPLGVPVLESTGRRRPRDRQ